MTTATRIYNFSAGPATLPLPVLEEVQRDLLTLPGVGMSVLEISHRSKPFDAILQSAEADIRRLAGVPDHYKVLFLQGGASLQFSMVPMNLLTAGATADYIMTGAWSQKALKEAKRVGATSVAATTEGDQFTRVPAQGDLKLTPGAAYVHMTSNNTIFGTEWSALPDVGDAPLVSDTSSDIFSGPIDVAKHGLIYAGAQKNLGPSGVTVVIIREDLLARSASTLPSMLSYAVQAEGGSLYNTPPTFGIYMLGLVIKWILAQGGLAAMAKLNERKAGKLLRRDRWQWLLPGHGAEGEPLADERDVPAAVRGAREDVHPGGDGGRLRRAEGAPVGRWHPGVDLQRLPGSRDRRPRVVHAGVRTEAGLTSFHSVES